VSAGAGAGAGAGSGAGVVVAVGDKHVVERTLSIDDVRAFTALSGDRGRHHVEPDAQGRLLAHGLLTATLFTQIGGQLNYLARTMEFEFLRPVYSGDALRAELTITRADDGGDRWHVAGESVCRNQHGKEVLKAKTQGVIFKTRAP
jgi:3-hydroxybutyryl-CoA dehydratase